MNSSPKGSDAEDEKTGFLSEVVALESSFQKIQNDYVRSIGSEESKEDYKDRMKVVSLHSLIALRAQ